jgi:hypothetical protein
MLVLPVLFRDACIDEQDVDAAMLFFTSATSDFTAVGGTSVGRDHLDARISWRAAAIVLEDR